MQHYPARSKGEYFGPWSLTDRSRFAACAWGDAPVQILHFRRNSSLIFSILFRTIASTPAFNRAVKNHHGRSAVSSMRRTDSIRELLTACDHWNAFPSVVRHNLLNKAEWERRQAQEGSSGQGDLPMYTYTILSGSVTEGRKTYREGKLWNISCLWSKTRHALPD